MIGFEAKRKSVLKGKEWNKFRTNFFIYDNRIEDILEVEEWAEEVIWSEDISPEEERKKDNWKQFSGRNILLISVMSYEW